MAGTFSQKPIGNVSMDATPSIGRYFGGPRIQESSLASTARLASGLVGLGISVNDKVQDANATTEANKIKEAGEDIVLSPSEFTVVDDRTGKVAKVDAQVKQGRLSVDRRDNEMRRLLKETPEHLRPAVLEKLRGMGIEDPAQGLIRRKAAQEENAIQVQLKLDSELVAIGLQAGDPNVYNTPGVPESGINATKARQVGLKRRHKLTAQAVALEALGQASGPGTTGSAGGGTSGMRPETALRFDPVFAQLRTDAVSTSIDSGADALLSQSNGIVAKLSNPASNLSNKDIELMVSQLHSNKNTMIASIQADLLKSGAFNAAEASTLKTELTAIFDEFVFDGSKDSIDAFKNKTLIVDTITRRDGRILQEKVPFLTAASKVSREMVSALVASDKNWSGLMGNLNDAKTAIETAHSASYDPSKLTGSTNEAMGKSYMLGISERAKVSSVIDTPAKANEVLNMGASLVASTKGHLPAPFKDQNVIDSLASEKHTSDLVKAASVGDSGTQIATYTYNTMMNTSERLLKRVAELPGFGSTFVITEKNGVFTATGAPIPALGEGSRKVPNPSELIEVKQALARVNKYTHAANKVAPINNNDLVGDLNVLRNRAGITPEQILAPVDTKELFNLPDITDVFPDKKKEQVEKVPVDLMDTLVAIESGGNPDAVSPVGARGLAQIMPETAAQPGFGMKSIDLDTTTPEEQVAWAKEYVGELVDRFDGNMAYALVAYNWGYGNAKKWVDAGADLTKLPKETQDYIAKFKKAGAL